MDTAQPLIADRYEIVRTLGQGAFGRTFLARDAQTDSQVAIKMFHPHRATDWKAFELFEREAAVLRSLRHHGVPEVREYLRASWEGADAAFLVMEYVEGTSLAQIISQRQHLGSDEVLHLFHEMLAILEYLHGRVPPILHRDIKPANIIVRPNGSAALLDFGAVRSVFVAGEEAGSTVVGTYGYMPYEQYMGQASPSSDLYALGATFLHLLTGRAPPEFIANEGRIDVPAALPGDARLRDVLARLLRPSPAERFPSARDVRRAMLAPATQVVQVAAARESSNAVTSSPAPLHPRALEARPLDLPPAPRAIMGDTEAWYRATAHSMWDFASSSSKAEESIAFTDYLLFFFFCAVTMGVMPAVFYSIARSRKRRMRAFFQAGVPGVAVVLNLQLEDLAFGAKLTAVSYEFEADGERRRDRDQLLPVIADRYRPGDQVPILYIPNRGYDSVIVAAL